MDAMRLLEFEEVRAKPAEVCRFMAAPIQFEGEILVLIAGEDQTNVQVFGDSMMGCRRIIKSVEFVCGRA